MPDMSTSAASYKEQPLPDQTPPPALPSSSPWKLLSSPSSSISATSKLATTIHIQHPRSSLPSSSERPTRCSAAPLPLSPTRSQPPPSRIIPSCVAPPSPETPCHNPKSADHYDWSPVLLFTPPSSSHGSNIHSPPLSFDKRTPPNCFQVPSLPSEYRLGLERNAVWPTSPTLATRRARRLSQMVMHPLSMPRSTMDYSAASDSASKGVSPHVSDKPQTSPQNESAKPSPPVLSTSAAAAKHRDSHKMILPTKPRALTLDGTDRPVLPPLFGKRSPGGLGPIRTSASRAFSSFRHGAEYSSNPYFVYTPARRSVDYFTPAASSSGSIHDRRMSSPFHTPTSSLRSTSGGSHHDDGNALGRSSTHTSSGPSPRLDGSMFELRPIVCDPTTENRDGGSLGGTIGSRLPSSHLAAPDNALGLFLEPAPFPSELIQVDFGPTAYSGLSPRTEADFFLSQAGASTNFLGKGGRTTPRVLTRSPAIMSEASSRVTSPSINSDDSLVKLPLANRYDINKSNVDPALAPPALNLHEDVTPQPLAASSSTVKPAAAVKDDSFIYKMPILRAMSPLADTSSDSEDQMSDEALAGPSTSPSPSAPDEAATTVEARQPQMPVPQEGRTGEIFATSKMIVALTLKQSRSDTTQKLFCKLNSTSHQCFSVVDGKWACYRRNYLKVDVSFHFEDEQGKRRDKVQGDILCGSDGDAPFVVERFAVHMTAHIINNDGRLQKGRQGLVPLIQFGPARERGPREAVQPVELRSGGSIGKDASANEQAATRSGTIAAFRRVQIRSATMNNGQRGAASQQFYALKLTLLAYPKQGPLTVSAGVEVASLVSHPITVRGRSKVHYAASPAAASAKRTTATSTVSRSMAAAPSTSKTPAATTSKHIRTKRNRQAGNSGLVADQRRSSRRRNAADGTVGIGAADTVQDADDEADEQDLPSQSAASRSVSKVMDIRSII